MCSAAGRRYLLSLVSLAPLCRYLYKHLLSPENLSDPAEMEAGFRGDVSHRQACRLRLLKALSPRRARLVALLLGALKGGLGFANARAGLLIRIPSHQPEP